MSETGPTPPNPAPRSNVALPPNARAVIYYFAGLYVPATIALQQTFESLGMGEPVWLKIMIIFAGFVTGAFGLTAASNTVLPRRAKVDEPDENGPKQW